MVDLPPAGDSVGDTLTFANEVFDARSGVKVGSDQGQCIRTVVGEAPTQDADGLLAAVEAATR